jgi:hypothetical protein
VRTDQPHRLVEDPEFQEYVTWLSGGAAAGYLFSRGTYGDVLQATFASHQAVRRLELAGEGGRVSLTWDCWTAPNGLQFAGVTGHWVDGEWRLRSGLLDFVEVAGSHTGSRLAEALEGVVREWGLGARQQLGAITADNASNVTAALQRLGGVEELGFRYPERHLRCFAHVLNLVVRDVVDHEAFLPTLGKLRQLATFVRAGGVRRATWAQCATEAGVGGYAAVYPLTDMQVRWSSTRSMISQAIMLRPVTTRFLAHYSAHGTEVERSGAYACDLAATEWSLLTWLSDVLSPFADVTAEAESQTVPTVHRVVPWHAFLTRELELARQGAPTAAARAAIGAGASKLAAYGEGCLADACYVATVLDPRQRLSFFRSGTAGRTADQVRSEFYLAFVVVLLSRMLLNYAFFFF